MLHSLFAQHFVTRARSRAFVSSRTCLLAALALSLATPFALANSGKDDGGGGGGGGKNGGEDGCSATGLTLSLPVNGSSIKAVNLPSSFDVKGKYISFRVNSNDFSVSDYTLIGGKTSEFLTPINLVVYSSKRPDLRGAALNSDVSVTLSEGSLTLLRSGGGVSVQLQAKDCASGGIFQMEAERADGTSTDYTHVLGPSVFYFNNPRFSPPPPLPLCPAGGPFTPACTPVPITPRVNLASDVAPLFVARDSPQDATKLTQTGGTSTWRVLSGGRLGGVLGEDAVEVAPPAVPCASHCKAQDQVQGKYPVLGFPSPVPASALILPR